MKKRRERIETIATVIVLILICLVIVLWGSGEFGGAQCFNGVAC